MVDLYGLITVLIGIAIRLAFPIFITALIVVLLRGLDAHWQAEARTSPAPVEKPACWEVMGCDPARLKDCPGYSSPLPCWQALRTSNGYLREQCLGCKVFLKAPVPILA